MLDESFKLIPNESEEALKYIKKMKTLIYFMDLPEKYKNRLLRLLLAKTSFSFYIKELNIVFENEIKLCNEEIKLESLNEKSDSFIDSKNKTIPETYVDKPDNVPEDNVNEVNDSSLNEKSDSFIDSKNKTIPETYVDKPDNVPEDNVNEVNDSSLNEKSDSFIDSKNKTIPETYVDKPDNVPEDNVNEVNDSSLNEKSDSFIDSKNKTIPETYVDKPDNVPEDNVNEVNDSSLNEKQNDKLNDLKVIEELLSEKKSKVEASILSDKDKNELYEILDNLKENSDLDETISNFEIKFNNLLARKKIILEKRSKIKASNLSGNDKEELYQYLNSLRENPNPNEINNDFEIKFNNLLAKERIILEKRSKIENSNLSNEKKEKLYQYLDDWSIDYSANYINDMFENKFNNLIDKEKIILEKRSKIENSKLPSKNKIELHQYLNNWNQGHTSDYINEKFDEKFDKLIIINNIIPDKRIKINNSRLPEADKKALNKYLNDLKENHTPDYVNENFDAKFNILISREKTIQEKTNKIKNSNLTNEEKEELSKYLNSLKRGHNATYVNKNFEIKFNNLINVKKIIKEKRIKIDGSNLPDEDKEELHQYLDNLKSENTPEYVNINFENKFKWEHIKQEKYNKIDKSNLTSHNKLSLRKYLDELFDSDENYEDLSKTFDLRFDKLSTKNKISEDKQKDNNQDNSEISNVNYNAPWKYH